MTIAALTGSRPWLAAGWTMLHFLWIGGAIGLVAAVGRRTLRAARPEVRYGFALSCLAALALTPVAIVIILAASAEPVPTLTVLDLAPLPSSVEMPAPTPSVALPGPRTAEDGADLVRQPVVPPWERLLGAAVAGLPWLWLCGAPATFALLATGLVGAERLRRQCRPLIDGELPALARRLATALRIARPVALAVCDRLVAPVLIGVIRPLILLPPAVLTGWSAEQIEMALLHELAHVRRLDNLANLVQRLVESLLFFHPVVWWVSGWVRLEREHCCDRLVVARTGRARPYAELLAALAVPGSPPGRTAVAMAESPVVARIRLILNPEDHSMRVSRPVVALAAALLLAPAVLITSRAALAFRDEDPKPEPAAPPAQAKFDPAKIDDLFRQARHGADMFMDVQGRVNALATMASARARLGDHEAARQMFREAVELGETVSIDDSYWAPHILTWVAQAMARNGFREEAAKALLTLLRIAEAPVRQEIRKSSLYDRIVEIQVVVGDRAGVQETLRLARRFHLTSKEQHISSFAPISIVALQATSGDLAGALRMVDDPELFKDPNPENVKNLRHGALFSIVQSIGPSNREGADTVLEAARRAAEAQKDQFPWRGQEDLRSIARALALLGRFDEAIKTAEAIDAETLPRGIPVSSGGPNLLTQRVQKAVNFAEIAEAQMKAGERVGARQSAREVIEIAGAIQDKRYKASPLRRAIRVLALAGEPAEALRIADTMSPALQVVDYEVVAGILRQEGDEAGARETLQAALKIVLERIAATKPVAADGGTSPDQERNRLLSEAGHLQAVLGDVKGAIESVHGINGAEQWINALKRLALDRAAADDLDGALEVIGQINGPKGEAEALSGVMASLGRRSTTPER